MLLNDLASRISANQGNAASYVTSTPIGVGTCTDPGMVAWESFPPAPAGMRAANCSVTDLCHIQYTAGTTGKPKGAMLTHGNWMTALDTERDALRPGDRDRLVAFQQSVALRDSLRKAGVDVEFTRVRGAGHVFAGASEAKAHALTRQIIRFFDTHLRANGC